MFGKLSNEIILVLSQYNWVKLFGKLSNEINRLCLQHKFLIPRGKLSNLLILKLIEPHFGKDIDIDNFDNEKCNSDKIVKKLMDIWKNDPINGFKILLRKLDNDYEEFDNLDISYKDAMVKSMTDLSKDKNVVFIGYNVLKGDASNGSSSKSSAFSSEYAPIISRSDSATNLIAVPTPST